MTVGFRADAETINGTAGTSVVVNRPTGTADGDVLVAFISGTGTPTISTPAGWTLIGTVTAGSAVRAAAFWKVASGEPASWTWTLGSSVRNGGWVGAYTAVDVTDPIVASSSTTDVVAGTAWACAPATLLPYGAGLGFAALSRTASGAGTTHTVSGTERADQTTNGGSGVDLSYAVTETVSLAGGNFSPSVTSSQSCANGALWTVTLRPAFFTYAGGETGAIVEAAFGGDPDDPDPDTNWVWTDISDYVMEDPGVTITKGRGDEQSQIGPTSVALSLDNTDGRFTPANVLGANYPNIRRGLPIRVSVPYSYVSGGTTERATAFVESFAPGWDTSLTHATVEISALGRLSRIRAGDTVRSPLFRSISGVSGFPPPQAYWPMEDGSGATQFACERGGRPMGVNTGLSPGSDSTLVGSAALPSYTAGGQVVGHVDPYTGTGQWSQLVAIRLSPAPVADNIVLDVVTTGTATLWRLSVNPGGTDQLRVRVIDSEGTQILDDSVGLDESLFYAGWNLLEMSAVQNGANIDYFIGAYAVDGEGITGTGKSGTLNSRTAGTVYRAGNGGFGSWAIEGAAGHFALFVDTDFDPGPGGTAIEIAASALDGQIRERTAQRFTRLLIEEGVYEDILTAFDINMWTEMGPQPVATLDTLLREIEDAEQGVVHDGGELGGLRFVDRAYRYNADVTLALDMESGHIAPGWSPTFDTQRLRNRSTVSRTGGSSDTYTADDTSEGIFSESLSLNLLDDTRLGEFASWRVHVGTAPGMRYPRVGLNLRRNPDLTQDWLGIQLGMSRVTATGLPSQHGPIDLDGFVEGYTEHLAGFVWTADLNLSPASPYTVGVWEDTIRGRADTDGSRLGSAINASVTSISVETTAGNPWITTASHAAEFPFDIKIDGEVMTVTAITSATSPQTFTVTRATDGTAAAHADEAAVNLANPMIVAL